jgi:tetratricopeptide (TPR) repeat protein
MLTHEVRTSNPQALAYYLQGLRCWHAYVSPPGVKNSAYQCFQHAANLDPDFAMAYWGMSLIERGPMRPIDAANRALELALKNGSDKERRFAAARVLELGGNNRREEFLDALDGAIAAYPDDVELWIWRGKAHGTGLQCIPYQLAAHRMRPEHPSPNHELVHAYEGVDRPALGWPYTEGFRRSAPNMPHAHHMQAHLAMRIGRWQEAIDCTRMSRRKSLEGYPELDPTHHIDILVRALAHEGRFKEAEAEPKAYRDGLPWARLLQLKAVPEELSAWAERRRSTNANDGFYIGALVMLDRGDLSGAAPFIARVEEQWKKNQNANLYRYHEVKGRELVQSGQVDEGLKLLREAAAKAVKDAGLHAWGGGSYMLEVWGETAIRARRWDEAEEAFHEALAHEHGSIVGALGMQVVWEQRGRSDMSRHYAARAAAIWKDADTGSLDRQLNRLRALTEEKPN